MTDQDARYTGLSDPPGGWDVDMLDVEIDAVGFERFPRAALLGSFDCCGSGPYSWSLVQDWYLLEWGAGNPASTPEPTATPSAPPPATPPPGWNESPPPPPDVSVTVEMCSGGPDSDLWVCTRGNVDPGAGDPFGAPEGGYAGGSGVAECEGAGATAVEDKAGYIAPPSLAPLNDVGSYVDAGDPIGWIAGGFSFVGDAVGFGLGAVGSVATNAYNRGVDALVPGTCLGAIAQTFVEDVQTRVPFAWYYQASTALEGAALGAGDGPAPEFEFAGETIDLAPMWASVVSTVGPYRGLLAAGLWLTVLLGLMRKVSGTVGAGEGGG